jgi:GNAT superfamily N-acetyltransferase
MTVNLAQTDRIEIVPATVDRFDDIASLVGADDPEVPACWCLHGRLSSTEFRQLRGLDRPRRLRQLCERDPSPGLVAYVDGDVAGWCSFGARPGMERLMRSRTIPRHDPPDTWCIVCFVVGSSFRRRGVAAALLDGVVEYARRHDAPAVEGYPIDTAGTRVSSALAYVGTVSMFQAAGFYKLGDTDAQSANLPRVVMRHDLEEH